MFKDKIKMGDQVTIVLGTPRIVLEKLTETPEITSRASCWTGKTVQGRAIYIRYDLATLSIKLGALGGSVDDAKEVLSIKYGLTLGDNFITLEEVAKLSEERFDFSNVLDI